MSSVHDQPTPGPLGLQETGEILGSLWKAVWESRRYAIRGAIVGGVLGLALAFGTTTEFTASTKLLPYRPSGPQGGLSSLAGLAGIRLPSTSGEQTVPAELYPEIARTVDFRVTVGETPIAFSSQRRKYTFVEYFDSVYERSALEVLGRYTVGLPGLLGSALGSRSATLRDALPAQQPDSLLRYTESYLLRLGELGDRLDIAIDKKTGIVTVSAKMPDPVAAADLVRVSSRSLMQAVIGIEAKKATEQLKFAEEQQLLAKQRFEIAQSALARFSARNRGGVDPTLMVESRRLEAEVAFATTLFEQLSREVEQARLRRSQDTPVFTVIQTVSVPPRKSEPRRAIILLLCVATAAAVGVLFSAARPSVNLNVG